MWEHPYGELEVQCFCEVEKHNSFVADRVREINYNYKVFYVCFFSTLKPLVYDSATNFTLCPLDINTRCWSCCIWPDQPNSSECLEFTQCMALLTVYSLLQKKTHAGLSTFSVNITPPLFWSCICTNKYATALKQCHRNHVSRRGTTGDERIGRKRRRLF